ncbi:beta-hexosaminidase subunit alpha isoform X1 [Gadus macrocephalus]|uniref:beta-hexosaminidase subunit alpha isoform X1 n=1 Tax=Gadus macrocephalus TaxID=80720 RepID=UPI0028CB3114|nr:beta-hexosaminidase subunit alpha isoform X1 [Gadus macrocephalus]
MASCTICLPALMILVLDLNTVESVWPLPQKLAISEERYPLSPTHFNFYYGEDQASIMRDCSLLDSAFTRYFPLIFPDLTSGNGVLPSTEEKAFSLVVTMHQKDCDGYPNEGSSERYQLNVSAGQAVLNSDTVWGALRGLETFSQLVQQDEDGTYFINKTEIEDFPSFQYRGILLDTSRHFLPLKAILNTLDAMAYSKFNVFHWHIVDDPSFPYQSRTFPDLSSKGAYHPMSHIYTQSDVRRVLTHARLRGIRVIPEFDSPGHTQSWGKGQPNLLTPCYKGSSPSGTFGPINPASALSYTFMSQFLKEVTSVFPDPYFHLGGDEVNFSCWQSNPDVRAFMQKMGFGKDYTKLESFYMENIVNITSNLNKTSIVWQDVFDYHERIPKDTILHIWKGLPAQYKAETSRMTKAGHRVLLGAPWYINHIAYGQDWRISYNVQPLNFSGTEEQKKLVIGGEVSMWGEYVDATNLSPRLWPRACAAAERLWSDESQTRSAEAAFPRLQAFRCSLLRRGVRAEPLSPGHCRNEYRGI